MCSGNNGALTAKAARKARNNSTPVVPLKWVCSRAGRAKVSTPVWRSCKKAVATMPTSRKAEPKNVYKKNLRAA